MRASPATDMRTIRKKIAAVNAPVTHLSHYPTWITEA
jgi:hypothetical protein